MLTALAIAAMPSLSAAAPPPVAPENVTLQFERVHRTPVPFEVVRGKFVFRATVAERPVWALLDTGMQVSLVDSAFAQQNQLTVAGPMRPLVTPTGNLPMVRLDGVKVAIPGQLSFAASMAGVDLGFATKYLGRTIDLVIGEPYTSSLALVVFGPSRRLEISPSGSLAVPAGTAFAPMTPGGEVEVSINGKTVRAKLDLGSAEDLVLTDDGWARVGLNGAAVTAGTAAGLDGSARPSAHTTVSEMRVGPFQATNVSVSRQLLTAKDGEAVVGLGFLARFNFAIDQQAGKLWLFPPTPGSR
ncbi:MULTISPECIES: aspartyl protease family protein [Sphingomonas]|uniref:aspartyl protease family protein n=1 Tax=Sphingomonas TaxID=13687 RepID=UPI00126A3B28|nr:MULTISPECIES: aspartyl protease family protein [Sphingomonas]